MENQNKFSRRGAIKSSLLGLVAVSIPNIIFSKEIYEVHPIPVNKAVLSNRYPSIDDAIVLEIVSVSHFNLDRVKELVSKRPELARATWDWSFGDWETAIGAASHTGRRDIANYLMRNGARPDIFTFAMLGNFEAVKSMIDGSPGIESIAGPHGINLLQHANAGLRSDGITQTQKENSKKLISYLEKLGTANPMAINLEMTDEEKEKYVGDYKYGDGPNDGLTVTLSKKKKLKLGRLGKSGGLLYNKGPHTFTYRGASSIEILFSIVNDKVQFLTVVEPNLTLKANKI